MKQQPKQINGVYLSELARGIGVSYPTIKAWLPGVGAKLKHAKVGGKGGYFRAWMSHADAAKIQAFAMTRKRIKQAKKRRPA